MISTSKRWTAHPRQESGWVFLKAKKWLNMGPLLQKHNSSSCIPVQGFNRVSSKQSCDDSFDALRKASVNDDSFDTMRKASIKKKDCLFDNIQREGHNIQFRDYDREAAKRYESAKAFRIPKKNPAERSNPTSNSAATMAVRGILSEMDSLTSTVTKEISDAQKDLSIEEENMCVEVEVTEVEIIVME